MSLKSRWIDAFGRVPAPCLDAPGGGKRTIAGGASVKAVGQQAASGARPDGSNVRPGVARLVVECGLSDKVVRESLKSLVAAGWLELVQPGNKRAGTPAVYRLTIGEAPTRLEHDAEIARVAGALRGSTRPTCLPVAATGKRGPLPASDAGALPVADPRRAPVAATGRARKERGEPNALTRGFTALPVAATGTYVRAPYPTGNADIDDAWWNREPPADDDAPSAPLPAVEGQERTDEEAGGARSLTLAPGATTSRARARTRARDRGAA